MADVSELSEEIVGDLIREISPQSRIQTIALMPGSFSNITHVVDLTAADDTPSRLVVRSYSEANGNQSLKARREYEILQLLYRVHKIPVPQPLYLDEQGKVLGMPGIVTSFMPGKQVLNPANFEQWASQLAQMLASIHSLDCDPATIPSLLNANTEAVWFLRYKQVPEFMAAYIDGEAIWRELAERVLYLQPVRPALIHLDYWGGNILWYDDQISAVLDWEEASYGDPAVDVGYARMGFYGMCRPDLADLFLREYEQAAGKSVQNLGFWELAASARNMPDPAQWLDEEVALGGQPADAATVREYFKQFIRDARQHVTP